jgi:hypothetical protein
MGAHLVALLVAAASFHQDTVVTYASPATRTVVVRAAARYHAQDTTVSSYTARIRYRLSVGLPGRRWAQPPTASVEEQVGRVAWQRPNDLTVAMEGRRHRSLAEGLDLSSSFARPWFVPRGAGDSLRIFSDEFPATGALHPLAEGAASLYHYDLTDSVSVALPGRPPLPLYKVQLIPKHAAPALVAGQLWVDAATFDVVRFSFRYVGTGLFAAADSAGGDSTHSRRVNRIANRYITIDVDLEYGQQDGRYWMPFRQVIVGTLTIPLTRGKVIPFQATTEFSDYEIGLDHLDGLDGRGGQVVKGEWSGGRFEIRQPPDSVFDSYAGWTDSLELEAQPELDARLRSTVADLARLIEELPDDMTDRRALSFGYERLSDALQYNRVQGLSLGAGARVSVPGMPFTDIFPTVRYGFSDQRVTGRLALVHDGPSGRFTFAGYRDVADVDPFSPGRTLANSASALFTAHDYGDYFLATGGEASMLASVGLGTDLAITLRGERQRSMEREARSWVNDRLGGDGLMPLNPPVLEGDFGIVGARLTHVGGWRWILAAEAMAGKSLTTGRAYVGVQRSVGGSRGLTVRLKAGLAEASAPPQLQFRLGGRETVRGFDYGVLTARAFWAGQLDVSPLKGTIRPVLFLDAGQAAEPDALFQSRALVGGGVGVSMYSPLLHATLIRLDVSHPISPDNGDAWRFDLVFSPVR